MTKPNPELQRLILHLRAVIRRHMQAPQAQGLHHVLVVFSGDGRAPAVVSIASDLEKFELIEDGVLNTMAAIKTELDAGNVPLPSTGSGTPGQSN